MKFINPLQWPVSRPRTKNFGKSKFREFSQTAFDLRTELRLLGAKNVKITSNMELTRYSTTPKQSQPSNMDPGIAIYFDLKKKPTCMAFDKFPTAWENLAAAVSTIKALRGIERWGGSDMMEEAFRGFEALPAPESWRETLNIPVNMEVSATDLKRIYRELSRKHHPDMGGNLREMQRINMAYSQACKEI